MDDLIAVGQTEDATSEDTYDKVYKIAEECGDKNYMFIN